MAIGIEERIGTAWVNPFLSNLVFSNLDGIRFEAAGFEGHTRNYAAKEWGAP